MYAGRACCPAASVHASAGRVGDLHRFNSLASDLLFLNLSLQSPILRAARCTMSDSPNPPQSPATPLKNPARPSTVTTTTVITTTTVPNTKPLNGGVATAAEKAHHGGRLPPGTKMAPGGKVRLTEYVSIAFGAAGSERVAVQRGASDTSCIHPANHRQCTSASRG